MTTEKQYPSHLGFLLDNPIRRYSDPPEKMIRRIGINGNDAILDFGCGPGFYTMAFARSAGKVVAADINPRMLEKVRKKAERASVNVDTIQTDGKKLDVPDQSFDLIFLNHVYHEIAEKPTVLAEFRRVIRPSGRIVIVENIKKPFLGFGPPAVEPKNVESELQNASFPNVKIQILSNKSIVTASLG